PSALASYKCEEKYLTPGAVKQPLQGTLFILHAEIKGWQTPAERLKPFGKNLQPGDWGVGGGEARSQ
ncbi:MAG: hypothetical protein PWK00_02105, partial [Coxiella burnetii]|nr:hypothetical protein [Coxiella burnetii]